jgi:hypothetical protein
MCADTSLDWRWGLAEWARHGPATSIDESAAAEAAAASAAGGLQVSVLNALRRHQVTLESELHAALMTAFLGPRWVHCGSSRGARGEGEGGWDMLDV